MDAMLEFMLLDLKEKLCPASSESSASSPQITEMPSDDDIPFQPLAKLLPVLAQLSQLVLRSSANPYLRVTVCYDTPNPRRNSPSAKKCRHFPPSSTRRLKS